MKRSRFIVILLIIIIILISYFVYNKYNKKVDNVYEVKDKIEYEYASIYLFSNGECYVEPINKNKIDALNLSNNLKNRLEKLYEDAIYYDIYINNYKLKAYKINLDQTVNKILKINELVYLLKDNNKVAVFNYDEYYNLMYKDVTDNYKDYKDVLDIKDNKVIYFDGTTELLQ